MSTVNPVFTKVYRDKILGLVGNDTNLGDGAGEVNQGTDCVAIGKDAGHEDQGNQAIAIGKSSGYTNQGADAIAIGENTAYQNQGDFAVAVGQAAGAVNQGYNAVAIGHGAAADNQGSFSVGIGYFAGNEEQQSQSVAIGFQAGMTDQATQSVAIGYDTGKTNQATNAVAIGADAGVANQAEGCVAIGYRSGKLAQGIQAIAIGSSAGYQNQGTLSVAIGDTAGSNNQGAGAVAIGDNAGQISQGQNSIAIGKFAAPTSQHAQSIMINATGNTVNTVQTDSCYVTPIRSVTSSGSVYPLSYNPTTYEISYANAGYPIVVQEVTTSGDTSYDVTTIPTWCKNVQVIFRNITWSSSNLPALFLGYTANAVTTIHNTTYNGLISSMDSNGTTNRAGTGTGVNLQFSALASGGYSGIFNLYRAGVYSTFENWVWSYQCFNELGATDYFLNGAGTFICPDAAKQPCNTIQIKSTVGTFSGGTMIVQAW